MKHAVKHIHFVGIGGAGMSGIAEILHNLGYVVSGTDQHASATTRRLQSLGVAVAIGHDAAAIAGADAVVVSTAVKDDNAEVVAARGKRVPVVRRAEMLAELMRLKQGIAIAGTHGKTTTTSLVASVLAEAGVDPTFVIGGKLNSAGAHSRLGSGDYIVVEADESDASFLNLTPVLSVVTNIDADHMETYGHDLGRLKQAFVEFLHRMPFYGAAIVCGDDAGVQSILGDIGRPVVTYGLGADVQVRAVDVQALPGGQMRFVVQRRNGVAMPDLPVTLNLPGEHNVRDALAAVAVAAELELPDAPVAPWRWPASPASAGASSVTASSRRCCRGRRRPAYGGSLPGGRRPGDPGPTFTLIDDYGHHPVEMAAVIAAARGAFPGRRLVLAFQPHRYTRTRDCFEDFVKVLGTADAVLLSEVYAAGEAPIVAADGRALARALRVAGKIDPLFVDDVAGMAQAIADNARDGDVVIVMGAGSIGNVPERLVEAGGGLLDPPSQGRAGATAARRRARSRGPRRGLSWPLGIDRRTRRARGCHERHRRQGSGQGRGADGRHLGRTRDLAAVGQRRAAGARRSGRRRAGLRPRRARPLRPLEREGYSRCFIALHGRHGEDGTVQGALELMRIPYTGSGVMASAIAIDKVMTKKLWRSRGCRRRTISSSAPETSSRQRLRSVPDLLGLPLIVKPPHEGSSIGVTKVERADDIYEAVMKAAKHESEVMCEEFIEGDEVTCAVLGAGHLARALPVIRIVAPAGNYDYQNKYFTDEVQYLCPSGLPPHEESEIQSIVLKAYRALGCRGWGRADLMIRTSDRKPFLLEMNTSPGMTGHSLVPMSAQAAGLSYRRLCLHLVANAALDTARALEQPAPEDLEEPISGPGALGI